MQKKMSDLKRSLILVVVIQAALLFVFRTGLEQGIMTATLILILEAVLFYYLTDRFEAMAEERSTGIREVLGNAANDAFLFAETGMIMYDDDHVITWMSELFEKRGINRVGRKVLSWLPEAETLLDGTSDRISVQLDDRIYEITRKEDEPVLFFKDITDLSHTKESLEEGRTVIGMASLDNYEESTQYEDDSVATAISVAVRTPITEYCKEHGILVKRVNNYRYFMVLNEKIFSDLAADHFSVLNAVRKAAQKQDVSITLSLAFARGEVSYEELDDMVSRLMDLAQSRGGDQVAVQKVGEEVKYFGGSSEATEKRSRVRVRVMAHTLRELISRSSNVIICGHKVMDFDCMGAAIGISRIAQALHKPSVIIEKTGGVEDKLKSVVTKNLAQLDQEVKFVTESEALNQLQEKTLVVMVDHHNVQTSNGAAVLERARSVAVIDHHRRSTEMGVKPVLVYIEAGASSACELITELFPYISNRIEISELDADIMLAGMTIDTGHFHVRTGSRTFDAASNLRRLGADPQEVDEFLKDTYEEFAIKAAVTAVSERYEHGVIITPYKGRSLSRTLLSQTADDLLEIQDVDAVFVIAKDTEGLTCISARSNGKVNVQVIMEAMKGGGHMTAAAVQRANSSVDDMKKELITVLNGYFKEAQDEGNTEK